MKLRQATILCALLVLCVLSASVLALEPRGLSRGGRGRGGSGGSSESEDDGWEVIGVEEDGVDLGGLESSVDSAEGGRGSRRRGSGSRRRGSGSRRRGGGSGGGDGEEDVDEPAVADVEELPDGADSLEGVVGVSRPRSGYTVKKLYGDKNDPPNPRYPRRVTSDLDTRSVYSHGAVPSSPQRVRLRGARSDLNPNEGRVEVKYNSVWGLVCDDHFGLNEASVACRSLGYSRGANKYYSGSFFGTGKFASSDILMERVTCSPHGEESGLHRCSHSHNFRCSVNNTAGVECTYNEGCEQGWLGYNGLCYRVEPTAQTAEDAASECLAAGATLVYVLSEGENSFISDLLHTKYQSINAAWTGGQFAKVEIGRGREQLAWVFRDSDHVIQTDKSHWFPGFPDGSSPRPTVDEEKKSCLALSKIFYRRGADKDTLVDYFWWDNISCKTRLPFICQKLATTSGCYNGTGENYMGDVSRTEDGSLCQSWGDDNPDWVLDTSELADNRGARGFRRRPNADAYLAERRRSGSSSSSSSSRSRKRRGARSSRGRSLGRGRGRGGGRRGDRTQTEGTAYFGSNTDRGRRRFLSWRRRDHNHCRNPDGDSKPWCWLDKSKGVFGYCNIGKCPNATEAGAKTTFAPTVAPGGSFNSPMCDRPTQFYCPSMMHYRPKCFSKRDVCDGYKDCVGGEDEDASFCRSYMCKDQEFYCSKIHRCIPQSRVCDKHYDCDYGDDETEEACKKYRPVNIAAGATLSGYSKSDNIDHYLNIPEDMVTIGYFTLSLTQCKAKCDRPENWHFHCAGFLYSDNNGTYGSECTLLSARLEYPNAAESAPATYYEKLETACQVSTNIVCKSGQCISGSLECNGFDDCGDFSDEIGPARCPDPRPTFEVRLSGGKGPYEGRIEVKLLKEWGLVCDDGLDASMGNLICNQLGYPQGAEKLSHNARREFGRGSGKFLMGSVNCTGTNTSLYDCQHSGWKNTNCSVNNVAGLVCRRQRACTMKEFRCSDRCVPLASVCNGVPDCSDGTDESACGKMTLALRGGSSSTSGILEITRGNISGVVCDDTFGPSEVDVACRHLNFTGRGRQLPAGSHQTPQNLVMWLQAVQCKGSEASLFNCRTSSWGSSLCDVSEAVAIECGLPETTTAKSSAAPTTTATTTTSPSLAVTGPASPSGTLLNSTSGICGRRFGRFPAGRIVNGYQASSGQFPWQVGIRVRTSSTEDSQWCGGTIVSDRWIVSASHCFEEYPKSSYVLRTGDLDNTAREASEREFDIDLLFKHPKYSGKPAFDYDLALIRIRPDRLGNFIGFHDAVQPACLPEATLVPPKGTVCHVSGWGSVGDFDLPANLMAANVPLIDSVRCNQLYADRITNRMLCAGFEAGGIDSCQGDSGGPLVCKIDDRYVLLGATSWGEGCAMPGAPGVYANVRDMRGWIDQTIRSNP